MDFFSGWPEFTDIFFYVNHDYLLLPSEKIINLTYHGKELEK